MFRKINSVVVLKTLFAIPVTVLLLVPSFSAGDSNVDINMNPISKQKPSQPAPGEANKEKSRGQLLYENNCGVCHSTSVHKRNPRKADSIGKIKYWVTRWSKELKLNWSDSDINAVTTYVNSRYYKFKE